MGIVINSADTAVAARAADKARERNNMVMRRDWCMLFQVLRVDTSDYCTILLFVVFVLFVCLTQRER